MLLNYSCGLIGYSKSPCEDIHFYDDNKRNDTSKVMFINRVVFDTTANMLHGIIVDSLTNKPIAGAKIYLIQNSKHYSDSSDVNGYFSFFKNSFDGYWQMMIQCRSYRCLLIKNINIHGGLEVTVKLHEWLLKE